MMFVRRLNDQEWQALKRLARRDLDECDIHLLPVLRSMWMLRGEQAQVPTPGLNRKRSLFEALEWDSGKWLYEVTDRRRSVEFIAVCTATPILWLLRCISSSPLSHLRQLANWSPLLDES